VTPHAAPASASVRGGGATLGAWRKARQRAACRQRRALARVATATGRAAHYGAPGAGFTARQWIALCDLLEGCAYCGRAGDADSLTIDHVVPLSRGGAHEAANIVPACSACNARKATRPAADFAGAS
jgi:5-methylcytosine-specific restriction endonuclease McrA